MALNATILKQLIETNIEEAVGAPIHAISDKIWQAIAEAIVTHIQTAGIVTVAVTTTGGNGTGIGKVT